MKFVKFYIIHQQIKMVKQKTKLSKIFFFVFLEESTSSSDLSTLTADLQLNGDEKSEDWLQVGKRNRTHVLRTVQN